jgi:heat shock protein HtpX
VRVADMMGHDEAMRERIKAYPGTITYIDLIRRNKFESAVLVGLMILLGGVIGALIGGGIAAGATGMDMVASAVVGGVAALIVAGFGAMWSWFGGANAILRMSGAVEVSPQTDLELWNVVDEMRIAAGLPMPRVYLIRETALNAFATGRDPAHAAVAITSGLRERLTRDELQGVIAHEVAHIRHYDIRFAMLMATMVGLIVFACDVFLRGAMRGGMRRSGSRGKDGGGAAVLVMLVLALVLAVIAPFLAQAIQMAYSRRREYLADAGAVELTRNPLGLAGALRKLAEDSEPLVERANRGTAHMFIMNPLRRDRRAHGERSSIFSSHPPVRERIARLMALVR